MSVFDDMQRRINTLTIILDRAESEYDPRDEVQHFDDMLYELGLLETQIKQRIACVLKEKPNEDGGI